MTKTVLKEVLVHGGKHVHVFSQDELIIRQTCFWCVWLTWFRTYYQILCENFIGLSKYFLALLAFLWAWFHLHPLPAQYRGQSDGTVPAGEGQPSLCPSCLPLLDAAGSASPVDGGRQAHPFRNQHARGVETLTRNSWKFEVLRPK